MKVIDAYPPHIPGKRPICEATLSRYVIERNEEWEKRDFRKGKRATMTIPVDQCDCYARYSIDGKWLCRKHAAYALLDSLAQPSGER